jgi:hypothetical protein
LFDRNVPWLPGGGDWLDLFFLTPTAFAASAFAFITAGAEVAPTGRKTVAFALAIIPVALEMLNVYVRMQGLQDPNWPLWRMTLDLVGLAIGVYIGLSYVLRQQDGLQSLQPQQRLPMPLMRH